MTYIDTIAPDAGGIACLNTSSSLLLNLTPGIIISGPESAPKISKADVTKAERREQQERQRAAKAATEAAGPQPSGSNQNSAQAKKGGKGPDGKLTKETKETTSDDSARGLQIFSHFGLPNPPGPSNTFRYHPPRIAISEFKIAGANAHCIATLRDCIQNYYGTPPNNTLSRHLLTHLSPQITHLFKLEISGSDIDLPEQDVTDQVTQETAGTKIKDGDVILTYARSSVVEQVLVVVVVDSRPMLEGKKLLSVLSATGIPCTYLLLPSIGSVITEVSTVLVGAHSLHSNGAVFSRAGTALVAMMAKQYSVPVVVCCETYKFAETVQLDSFTKNELDMFPPPAGDIFSFFPLTRSKDTLTLNKQPNLEILNPLYDLTPPSTITAVVTEVGVIPPSSISSIPLALGRTTL
ncbi:hypothetical protein F4604DRAFT_1876862 [Suillus subluteus]|nr:hypothetical protein F4604DRAFT_1876862 [Suillus subluteus]